MFRSGNLAGLNITWILKMLVFWMCVWFWLWESSENARVTQCSDYVWICLSNSWIYMIMPEYAWIFLNISKWLLFLHFPILIPCLHERVVTYPSVCTKLEDVPWEYKFARKLFITILVFEDFVVLWQIHENIYSQILSNSSLYENKSTGNFCRGFSLVRFQF